MTADESPRDATSSPPDSRFAGVLLAGSFLLFLGVCLVSWDQIEEDAFIYYRVAQNLADGQGFTFNPGEAPVECSSSLLFQFLLVPVVLLPMDLVLAAKGLGLLLGLLTLWLTHRLALRLTGDRLLAALSPWILASCLPFTLWAHRGLETPFYNCVLLGTALCACHPRLRRWWFLPTFLLIPSRPEGFLIAAGVLVFLLPQRRVLEHFGRSLVWLFLLCAGLLAARIWYFHDFVPNPFYTKFQGAESKGWSALATLALQGHLLWVVVPAVLAALTRRRWTRQEVLVLGLLGVTVLWAGLGEDWKPYNRHLVPALPFLAVCVALSLKTLARRPRARALAVVCFLATSTFMLLHGRAVYNFTQTWDNPLVGRAWQGPPTGWPVRTPASDRIFINSQATVGRFLHDNYPEGVTILYDQMGQTPWYAGMDKPFLDTLGLVNRAVGIGGFNARHADGVLGLYRRTANGILTSLWPDEPRDLDRRGVLDHLVGKRPGVILLHEALLRNRNSLQSRLLRDERVRRNYRARYVLNGSVRVLERKDLESRSPPQVPEHCTVEPL